MERYDEFFKYGLVHFLCLTVVVLILCTVGSLYTKHKIKKYSERFPDRVTTKLYLNATLRFLIWFLGFVIILKQITPLDDLGNTILGASGIFAAVMGIAAQSTFGNYIAGFFISVHQPFKVGDIIHIKDLHVAGTVQTITFRHTVIKTKDNNLITIPNTTMNSVMIEDLSYEGYAREVEIKVAPDTEMEMLEKCINETLTKVGHNPEGGTKIQVNSIDSYGYKISFPIRADSLEEYIEVKNKVIPALYKTMQEYGIQLSKSFPML